MPSKSKAEANRLDQHNRQQIEYYSRFIKATMKPEETRYISRQLDELISVGAVSKRHRILEVGCGMGRFTIAMARRGYNDLEGMDITPFLLERFDEFNNGEFAIPTFCADIQKPISEREDRYDRIVGFMVLHHFKDLSASFKTMYSLLKPGGKIVFLEPNALNALYYIQITLTPGMTWQGDGGVANMRKNLLFKAISNVGFTELNLKRWGFFPPVISNTGAGAKVERILEKFPPWKSFLPFQLISATKPD
ncbi:class I SAM-dependent methyltransferase [Calditrichota bacterium]